MSGGWTHLVCERCWNALRPDRLTPDPGRSDIGDPCCRCGRKTLSGIFYRAEPGAFSFCEHERLPESIQDDETTPAIERLLQRFAVGDRVRTIVRIFDASSGREVAEGKGGTVRATNVGGCTPLVSVAWDGETEPLTTSAEHLEPVPVLPIDRPIESYADPTLRTAYALLRDYQAGAVTTTGDVAISDEIAAAIVDVMNADPTAEVVPGIVREGQRFIPAEESDVFLPITHERRVTAGPAEIIARVKHEGEPGIEIGNVLRGNGFLPARRMPDGAVFVLDPDAPLPPPPPSSGDVSDDDVTDDNARERRDRAVAVVLILDRCREELERLEQIPADDPDDVNAISAAKGYVQRAQGILRGRFA